ncbi:MAG: hypothetical protein JXR03_00805 [Cyclobacteriaceae bacterium]
MKYHVDYKETIAVIPDRMKTEFIRKLDPETKYFTTEDELLHYEWFQDFSFSRNQIDLILENSFASLKEKLSLYSVFLADLPHVNFTERDSVLVAYKTDSIRLAPNQDELTKSWIRDLKFKVLNHSYKDTLLEDLESSQINDWLNQELQKVVKIESCIIESLDEELTLKRFVLTSFLKSYAQSFDAHSDYLSPEEEEWLLTSLSSEVFSTGLIFRRKNGRYVISKIQPYSSASLENLIKVGDEITSVRSEDDLISLSCLSLNAIEDLFYGTSSETITLEIKSKSDNQFREFELSKRFINNTSNHVYSYLLQNDSLKIGYIQLPGFYTNFGENNRSSAQDMALALLRLKKQSPEGLIVDLRGNGGGSIAEAHDLIGFFMDYGPAYILTSFENKNGQLFKDGKRGKLLDVKTVFLIDEFSASASELLATSVRHYPNNLIVGSPSFGKATGQIIMPFESRYQNKPQGIAAITDLKIYGINGLSYQGEGVIPSIVLPSLLSKNIIGESNLKYNLSNPIIGKSFTPPHPNQVPIDDLSLRVEQRKIKNTELLKIDSLSKVFDIAYSSHYFQSLDYREFELLPNPFYKYNPSESTDLFQIISSEEDEFFKKESEAYILNGRKDPILEETFNIIKDWIYLSNKKDE